MKRYRNHALAVTNCTTTPAEQGWTIQKLKVCSSHGRHQHFVTILEHLPTDKPKRLLTVWTNVKRDD